MVKMMKGETGHRPIATIMSASDLPSSLKVVTAQSKNAGRIVSLVSGLVRKVDTRVGAASLHCP